MSSITVFTTESCVQCDATKRALDRLGAEYDVVDITNDAHTRDMLKARGFMGAPVVMSDEDTFTGFRPDRLKALVQG